MKNNLKATMLLGTLTALLILIGNAVGGKNGMIFAFFIAGILNFGSYWFSDRLILTLYRAREADEASHPQLNRIVRNLATSAGLPMPKVYIVPNPAPNAFATGRDPEHAAVAVTTGIMELLSPEELEGVLAHELAHVRNRDTLISAIAATVAGAVIMLARWAQFAAIFGLGGSDDDEGGGLLGLIALAILAPIAAIIIQMAISRSREYYADEGGARICGNPLYLSSALRKLGSYRPEAPVNPNPSTAHMFIVSPLYVKKTFFSLFSTHPPVDERVARLEGMAHGKEYRG